MFYYQEEFIKKKVSGEIAFDVISLFLVWEHELPQEHLSFLKNFIITKYLKQEVDDDLSICMDEHSRCGLSVTRDKKILSISCDQKVMMLLPPIEKHPSILELLLLIKFDSSSSFATNDIATT